MTVVITGATGLIGSRTLAALRERGTPVVSVGRTNPRVDGVRHVDWDLSDDAPAEIAEVAARATAVVHCAAVTSDWAPADEVHAVNVTGTRRIADAFPKARLVHLSSTAVYGTDRDHEDLYEEAGPLADRDYRDAYALSKAHAEQVLARVRADALILRPSQAYLPNPEETYPSETRERAKRARKAKNGAPAGSEQAPASGEASASASQAQPPSDGILARLDRFRTGRRSTALGLPDGAKPTVMLADVDTIVAAILAGIDSPEVSGPINVADAVPTMLRRALIVYLARTGAESRDLDTAPADYLRAKALAGEAKASGHLRGGALRGPKHGRADRRPEHTVAEIDSFTRRRTYDLSRLTRLLGHAPSDGLGGAVADPS